MYIMYVFIKKYVYKYTVMTSTNKSAIKVKP